jgi:hypothetical protein
MKEPNFVAAFLQVPQQPSRQSVQLTANASFGITPHCGFHRKRFVCTVEVKVFYSSCRRKLKSRVATGLLLVSSTIGNASAIQKLLQDGHDPGFSHLDKT